jgi:hypothetical protein
MYYKVFINGKELGVFGHDNIENIQLSIGGGEGEPYFFASAVCTENNKQIFYDWLQKELEPNDIIEIRPTSEASAPEPRKKFVMGKPQPRKPSEEKICDFCQRKETEVSDLVYIDENRPAICADCVELCQEILRGRA